MKFIQWSNMVFWLMEKIEAPYSNILFDFW